jgi:hypothetical protein
MAIATVPLTFAQAVVAAPGTSVAPSAPIPSNCVAVTLLNTSKQVVLVGIAAPGGALTEGVDCTAIPANGNFTIPIGKLSERGIMDETITPGSGLVYDAVGGAATIDITYKNILGGGF